MWRLFRLKANLRLTSCICWCYLGPAHFELKANLDSVHVFVGATLVLHVLNCRIWTHVMYFLDSTWVHHQHPCRVMCLVLRWRHACPAHYVCASHIFFVFTNPLCNTRRCSLTINRLMWRKTMRFNVFVCVTSGPADFKKTHIMTQVVYFFNLALVLRISFQDTCSNLFLYLFN